jgi:hypothetical protein
MKAMSKSLLGSTCSAAGKWVEPREDERVGCQIR